MINKNIKFKKIPKLKNPYLVAAWPGMGNVAISAVEFLCEQLKPVEFGELSTKGFFYPHEAWINDGQIEFPRLPEGRFFYWKNTTGKHDLIIFLCDAQPSFEKGYGYAQLVLNVADSFKVKRIYTFASIPMPIDHTQESRTWVTVTDKKLLKEIAAFNVKSLVSGQISGLNGLLLSAAKEQNIEGFCFLAEIPLYSIQIENPKASKSVIALFAKIFGLSFDFSELDQRAKIVEEEIEKLIEYFKSGANTGPISEEEIENIKKSLASVTRLPESARLRIEELFKIAEHDITSAITLKEELDRWHMYKDYEDRFLDLFRQKEKDNN